ncbi:MAG TPA: DUF3488 domain-containing protein, partial [Magnetococcales bacterium]|nr:DUF3488 domain-containing protein [Magnetococcales bacterium]
PPPRPKHFGPGWIHEVTMEPNSLRYMFALEFPQAAPPGGQLSRDRQMVSLEPIDTAIRYTVISHPDFSKKPSFLELDKSWALALPGSGNARARRLAQTWRETFSHPEAIVRAGLDYFVANAFVYTLSPPLLAHDSIDGFLFDTRKGFCEHYAGAFTFLMRSAGVPARIVTGYQGGTLNPLGDHLTVRNSDAHAWTEAWLPDQGWVRIDPTAVVSPSRVETGIQEAIAREPGIPPSLNPKNGLLQQWRNVWDLADHRWNQIVLGFDAEKQMAFWSYLGWSQPESWELVVALLLATAAFPFIFSLLARVVKSASGSKDVTEVMYQKFCRKLARAGVARFPWEGALTFGERAGSLLPQNRTEILLIAKNCSELRYEKNTSPDKIHALDRRIRAFKPQGKQPGERDPLRAKTKTLEALPPNPRRGG